MWAIFKIFTEFATILLLSYVLFLFWLWGMWDSSSPTLEGEVLTTGPQGKSLSAWLQAKHSDGKNGTEREASTQNWETLANEHAALVIHGLLEETEKSERSYS